MGLEPAMSSRLLDQSAADTTNARVIRDLIFRRDAELESEEWESEKEALVGDATLPGESAATLSVRLRSQARFVAESSGEYVQQDGTQHAPGDPGAEQTRTHPANPPVFPRSQCGSRGIPMEV